MNWFDDLQVYSCRHKIKCKQIIKTPMHPTTITVVFVKPDIVSLLFVDVASSLKVATLENKYSADEVPTVISPLYGMESKHPVTWSHVSLLHLQID